jgi:hypothetical protein
MIAIEKGDLSALKKCVLESNTIGIDASIVDKNNNSIWHKLALCKNNTQAVCDIFSGQPVFYEENSDKPILDTSTPRKYHLDPKYTKSKPFYYDTNQDYKNNDDRSPLIMAAQNDNPKALKFFIAKGTKIPRYFKKEDYAQGDCIEIIYDELTKQENLMNYQKDYTNMVNTNPVMYNLFQIIEKGNYYYLNPIEENKKAEIDKLFDALDIKIRNTAGHSLFEILITQIYNYIKIDHLLYSTPRVNNIKITGVELVSQMLSTLKLIYSKAFLNDKNFKSCYRNIKKEISHEDAPLNVKEAFEYILKAGAIDRIASAPPPCTKAIKINTLKILDILGANKFYLNKMIQEINTNPNTNVENIHDNNTGLLLQDHSKPLDIAGMDGIDCDFLLK